MPREKELYRENLVRIKEMYPDKELLNIKEVRKYTGVSYEFAKKRFPFDKYNHISVTKLASELS